MDATTRPTAVVCTRCGVTKPFTREHFPPRAEMPFGMRKVCRGCFGATRNRRDGAARRRLRVEVLSHYSGGQPACNCCGTRHFHHLALDHLEGSSQEDYRKHKTADAFLRSLKKEGYPPRFAVACHNCNTTRSILGRCPHKGPPVEGYSRKGAPRTLALSPLPLLPRGAPVAPARKCRICHDVFPLDEKHFHRHERGADLRTECKGCTSRRVLLAKRRHTAAARLEAMTHYCGGAPTCACCGETQMAFLTIDHVNGGGAEHRRREKFADLCDWLIKRGLPEGFRVLCYCCNLAAGFYGRCECRA